MGRLPSLKNLKTEDYPKQKSWIGKLLQPMNQFIQQVYSTLNGNVEFDSNIRSQIKRITVDTTDIDYPVKFQSTLGVKAQGLLVIDVRDLSSNPTSLTNSVFIDFEDKNRVIHLNKIIGLNANTRYELTLLVI